MVDSRIRVSGVEATLAMKGNLQTMDGFQFEQAHRVSATTLLLTLTVNMIPYEKQRPMGSL